MSALVRGPKGGVRLMCKGADYLAQDAVLDFSQDDMPYFRRRITLECIRLNDHKAHPECALLD